MLQGRLWPPLGCRLQATTQKQNPPLLSAISLGRRSSLRRALMGLTWLGSRLWGEGVWEKTLSTVWANRGAAAGTGLAFGAPLSSHLHPLRSSCQLALVLIGWPPAGKKNKIQEKFFNVSVHSDEEDSRSNLPKHSSLPHICWLPFVTPRRALSRCRWKSKDNWTDVWSEGLATCFMAAMCSDLKSYAWIHTS